MKKLVSIILLAFAVVSHAGNGVERRAIDFSRVTVSNEEREVLSRILNERCDNLLWIRLVGKRIEKVKVDQYIFDEYIVYTFTSPGNEQYALEYHDVWLWKDDLSFYGLQSTGGCW
ncbi:MAG: hypothetical protein N2578_06320 [Bdellovibrionaceae bacterium]|nr:hypothetical protein [Pseudobdellovibrionaceae bacterium]